DLTSPVHWPGCRSGRRSRPTAGPLSVTRQRSPPETYRVSPVIQASGDARNTTAGATSCGWLILPSGVSASTCLWKSLPEMPAACRPSVSTAPGLTPFTRMLRGPSSWARERVIAFTAALVPLYTDVFGGADVAANELMLTMLPPEGPKCLTASCVVNNSPAR